MNSLKGAVGTGVSKVEIIEDKLVITLSDTTVINLGNIKGAKGDKGDQGEQGVSITAVTLTVDGDLSMTFSSGETIPLGNIKGQDGTDGVGIDEIYIQDGNLYVKKTTDTNAVNLGSVKGEKGDKGVKGDTGEQGSKGEDGVDGKSAYELYKQAHPEYIGTLDEWLASLKGETGRGILRTEISDSKLIIYYTDNTLEEHNLSGLIGNQEGTNQVSYLTYTLLEDDTYSAALNSNYIDSVVSVSIPATYNGKPVTVIAEKAFYNATMLEEIFIPESITTIGNSAFYGCKNLSITIPETVTTIKGGNTFWHVKSLQMDFENWSVSNVTIWRQELSGDTWRVRQEVENYNLGWTFSEYIGHFSTSNISSEITVKNMTIGNLTVSGNYQNMRLFWKEITRISE